MKNKLEKCPACCHQDIKIVEHFKFRDFDGSVFNMAGDLYVCENCGFVRVLSFLDDDAIERHYENNSLYSSLSGVGVGGSTDEDLVRYRAYVQITKPLLQYSAAIADIGCSSGGLLKFIQNEADCQGKLIGIDLDLKAMSKLESIEAVKGSVRNLNLAADSLDFTFYTHIFEHILDIDQVISEMVRVVSDEGYAFIEVPDASMYSEARVHDYFWMGMKEHVNHFTPKALCKALYRHGVEVQKIIRTKLPMKGAMSYPSLIALVKIKKNHKNKKAKEYQGINGEQDWFRKHMECERLYMEKTKQNINAFIAANPNYAIWGIGHEFFNMLALNVIDLSDDTVLMDSNDAKQIQTVSNNKISAPKKVESKDALLCTSHMSWQQITQHAKMLGFDEAKIFCL